jgi:extracellular factor (EF) 3-hydroxypalmitic acid methyl ester biosynthesis protein
MSASEPPQRTRSAGYEDREGGAGPNVYFRAERFPARELLERAPAVLLVRERPQEVHDLSMNGVAFFASPDFPPARVGDRLPIRLNVADSTAYTGEGEVVRIDAHRHGKLIGLRLAVGFLDIPGLVATHNDLMLRRDLARGARADIELLSPDYRQLCADMVAVLRYHRSLTGRFEKQLGALGGDRRGRYAAMLDECYARLNEEWDPLRLRANELTVGLRSDPERMKAAKRFTELVVTPELVGGPAWQRSYTKPLGYPGDYEIMNYFYAQAWEGNTAFEKVLHRLMTRHPLAACVIPRMEMLRDAIAETVERQKERKEPVRIASLGSGPAREVEEYLRSTQPRQPIHFLLIDQDERALSYAHGKLYPLAVESPSTVGVECWFLSFSQLIQNFDFLRHMPPQDLIYTAGLVDYLKRSTAKTLIKVLFAHLAPGGRLVVGNMLARPDVNWTPEFVLDWQLIFRTESEMLELASELGAVKTELRLDSTGCTYLLFLTAR